jgi:hypothetical protein
MKSTFATVLLTVFLIGSWPSFASAEGFTGWRKIGWIYQRQCSSELSDGFEIQLAGPHDNPDGCSNDRTIQVQCFNQIYDNMVDITRTTFTIGGQLRAFVNGCDDDGHAIVTALQARQTPSSQ